MRRIFIISFLAAFLLPIAAIGMNEKPFVVPELRNWKGAEGSFMPTELTISVQGQDEEATRIANAFAEDYNTMFGKKLTVSDSKTADFIFRIKKDKALGDEGYRIKISKNVLVTAPTYKGLFWATRTLLQMSESNLALPQGEIEDYPEYSLRGFMIDAGRKFFPLSMLRDYVKILAYYKMNTFQIHLNDCSASFTFQYDLDKTYTAFRLESETFPGLAARDGYYTKQEFIDFQIFAEQNYVNILPEIDVPAHSLAFTRYKPEIASKDYGKDHLDLFNDETYKFLDALFKEYIAGPNPVFRGERVGIGTDEYSNKDTAVVEKFRYFTDYYLKYVKSFGKKPFLWGSLTHAAGKTPVTSDDVWMEAWYNGYADPKTMVQEGYKLISIPDGLVYIVPNAGYYYDYLNEKYLYEKWTPANVGKETFPEKDPAILGGMFAVWNDMRLNGITTKDVHYRCFPAVQTIATETWTGRNKTLSYEDYDAKRQMLSEAPGVNVAGYFKKGTVLDVKNLEPNTNGKYDEIGYSYKISFDIDAVKEEKGTILTQSDDAIFYLSDPSSGLISWMQDGYFNRFFYQFYPGEKAHVEIVGNPEGTSLYVNGKLIENKNRDSVYFRKDEKTYRRMPRIYSLTFPLKKTGDFKSTITNFKVESLSSKH
jgi:hexosaminidase